MQVSVTVYGLSGIICRTGVDQAKKARRFSRGRSSGEFGSVMKPFDVDESGNSTVLNPKGPTLENDAVPTTAIVSFRRNAISSATDLETFLPSLPLAKPTSGFGNTLRYMASWSAGENPALLEVDEQGPSTFKMIRVMKGENYHPEGAKIAQLSGFVHETIDLGVCLGKGKEMIPLGVASFAITGDEEGEVILNLPVKSKPREKKKKRTKKAAFPQDPNKSYLLDDNATLRVGLRVLPQHTIQKAKDRIDQDRVKEKRSLEAVLEGLFDENLVLELNDESSLLDRFVANQKKKLRKELAELNQAGYNGVETPQSSFPAFFCGVLTCSSVSKPQPETSKNPPTDIVGYTESQETTSSAPLTLMSSVSESTGESDPSSIFRRW
jgi:hypothetical protein